MTVEELIGKVQKRLEEKDFSRIEKFAVQVNLTGRIPGVFYVEILHGKISIMPYEYIDRDALVSTTITSFDKIITGKLDPKLAFATGKIKFEGDMAKLMDLAELLK